MTSLTEWATSTTLLSSLKEPNSFEAWQHFVGVFRPILVRHACRRGFSADEAEDIAQRTLAEFFKGVHAGMYQRGKGRLRDWLLGIARNQSAAFRRERAKSLRDQSARPVDQAENAPDARWEAEWRDSVVRLSLERVARDTAPRTYEAFLAFAIRGEPAAAVAARLGMTENAVFLGKRRILEQMRSYINQLESEL